MANEYVKWKVFIPVVIAVASLFVIGGTALWNTAEKANAAGLRIEAINEARTVYKETQDREYQTLTEQIKEFGRKLDTLSERIP